MSEDGSRNHRPLPPGAADLISQLTVEEECKAILNAIIEKNFCQPRIGQNAMVNGNLGFPEELRDNQNLLDELSIEAINHIDKIREGFQEEFTAKQHREDGCTLNSSHKTLVLKRYEIVSAVTEDGVAEPYFWLSAMKAHKDLKKLITEQDLEVLKYLRDVRYSKILDPTDNKRWSCKLEFLFDPSNPYFSNTVLTKVFEFSFQIDGVNIDKAEGTTIHWNKEQSSWPTKGFSFFNFFMTKNAPKEEVGEVALRKYLDNLERDYHLCGLKFINEVIPHALTLCSYPGLKPRRKDEQLKIRDSEAKKDGSD